MYDTFDNTYQATIGKQSIATAELINRYRLLVEDHVSGRSHGTIATVGYRYVMNSSLQDLY